MKTFKLHLVRHGLTQGNLDGIFMGGGVDMPLCEKGVEQLKELQARFAYPEVDLLFCSPMARALQTAELLFPGAKEKRVLEALRENRFGEFEGKSVEELTDNPDFAKWLDSQSDFVPKGGESGRDFAARCAGALAEMMVHLAKNDIKEAACVTHGGVIMSMLAQMALPKRPPLDWMADNGCGYTVQADAAMLMRDGIVEAVEVLPYGYLD